jgi:hypothetical protein
VGVGDRNYRSPELRQRPAAGVALLAPCHQKGRDPDPGRSRRVSAVRSRPETVNGQLAERYNIKRAWAKDLWHLWHRVTRKVLSHTVVIALNVRAGHQLLRFDALAA